MLTETSHETLAESKQRVFPFYYPSMHQISTLEKTKFHQHSIRSSLVSVRVQRVGALLLSKQRVSLFYRTYQLVDSEDFDYRVFVFTGLSDAMEDSADGALSLLRAIKFIIGLDFAVTLSSPASFCVLFDITSEHCAELKWPMLNKHKRWFHSSRVKFPLAACLRIGSRCQRILFGSWGPK